MSFKVTSIEPSQKLLEQAEIIIEKVEDRTNKTLDEHNSRLGTVGQFNPQFGTKPR